MAMSVSWRVTPKKINPEIFANSSGQKTPASQLCKNAFLVIQKVLSGGEQMISATSGCNPFEKVFVKNGFTFSNFGVKNPKMFETTNRYIS